MPTSENSKLIKLATVIKQQRTKLKAIDVGLPINQRRKVGLSQQEVAVLSGISIRVLGKFERGEIFPDDLEALSRVLKVLKFSDSKQHALLKDTGFQLDHVETVDHELLINKLEHLLAGVDYPAFIVDCLWNRVSWNKSASRLFTHWLGKRVQYHNLIDYLIFDPQSRLFIKHWQKDVSTWLQHFFINLQAFMDNEVVQEFINSRIKSSPVFSQYLKKSAKKNKVEHLPKSIFLTNKGEQEYTFITLPIPDPPNWFLVIALPEEKK